MNQRKSVRMLTEGGIMIALSALLSHIIIYQAPQGGSVSAGSMVPLMIFAIRWGMGPGFAVGITYGILDFILKPYFYHPIQLILDYPLAYGIIGLSGLGYIFKKHVKLEYLSMILGVTLGVLGRMISHVVSGVVFFADAAGTQNPWIYSIGYNATYLIPELIISIVLLALVWKPLQKFTN